MTSVSKEATACDIFNQLHTNDCYHYTHLRRLFHSLNLKHVVVVEKKVLLRKL